MGLAEAVEAASQQALSCLSAPPGPLLHADLHLGPNHRKRGATRERAPYQLHLGMREQEKKNSISAMLVIFVTAPKSIY